MNILTRHKKNAENGFKKFTLNLETMTEQKQKDILEIAFLEDPIYTRWIIQNIIDIDYLLKLDDSDILKIYKTIPQPLEMFLYSFINTKWEKTFLEQKFPHNLKKQYLEEKKLSAEKITKSQKDSARFAIIKKIREFQDSCEIPKFDWKIPTHNIVSGLHMNPPKEGEFIIKYDEGTVALQGQYKAKLREGNWKHYFPTGSIMAEGNYADGEKTGEWTFYFPSTSLKAEGYYDDNLKNGEWFVYDKSGKMKIVFFERGKII
ncbi:MAG: hypothetical protein KAQ98_08310 [Bacteriovoracaceae bacterium]|nr:hypothetical protein [Bacteriovoracaceae bacterium]